jgi:hypothetical protein
MSNYKYGFCCDGIEISRSDAMCGFMLVVKQPIQTRCGVLPSSKVIHGVNVTSGVYRQQGLIMESGAIYFEFDVMGIEPSSVEGVDFHDLFDVKVMGINMLNNEKPQRIENNENIVKRIDDYDEILDDLFRKTISSSLNMHLTNNDWRTKRNNNYCWKWTNLNGESLGHTW